MNKTTRRRRVNWFLPIPRALVVFLLFLATFCISSRVQAANSYSSTNFVNQDPVILSQGGRSTSTNFELISGTGQNEIGESSSANFGYRSGYFYFPLVTSPVLSGTAGDSQVSLTWSAAVGSLGFTVGGYQVGQSTSVSGPFSYNNVGNVLSSTRTGLTNSTPYYFLVRALDVFGVPITSSTIITLTPVAAATTGGGIFGSGGGDGGAPSQPQNGSIQLNGLTVPSSKISVLLNGILIKTVTANNSGNFNIVLEQVTPGTEIVSLYATDENGLKSAPTTFLVTIEARKITIINNIFLSPTITTDKEGATIEDAVEILGSTFPFSNLTIFLNGPKNIFIESKADAKGKYKVQIPPNNLPVGTYSVSVRSEKNGITSPNSRTTEFTIGSRTIPREPYSAACPLTADFNSDCKVDLVDFSILLYWFYRTNPPTNIDLNDDNYVNITDFSIMMYYWTG